MKRKLTILFALLTLSAGLWAQQVSYRYPVYIDNDPAKGIATWQIGSADATEITNTTTVLNAGWYVVRGADVETSTLVCNGAVNIILADGAKLTATGVQGGGNLGGTPGIQVSGDGNSLSIYVQSFAHTTMGRLFANGKLRAAGIGGDYCQNGSNITINGGMVTVTSGLGAAGIGGGTLGNGSYITINGGEVIASSGGNGAGIGGGASGGNGSFITINGGKVMATGNGCAAGIGGGGGSGNGSNIIINGGEVKAIGRVGCVYGGDGIGGGDEGSGSNIFVATNLILKADGNNPPTTEIENDGTDLASQLAGKQYVTIVGNLATAKATAIAEINVAIEGVTDTDILAIANTAIANINNATTVELVTYIKDKALADIADAILAKAKPAAIVAINDVADAAKVAIDAASTYEAAKERQDYYKALIDATVNTATNAINKAKTLRDVEREREEYVSTINEIRDEALAEIADINKLVEAKAAAIAAINEAIKDLTLFPKEQEYIEYQIEHIQNEESVEAVNSTKNATLAFIALHDAKVIAIAELKHDMGDYAESEAIYDFIGGPAIEAATSADKITEAKNAALAKLEEVSVILGDAATAGYNKGIEEGKAELLGEMAEPCEDCPAVDVTKGDKTVKLYNPEKVEFKKE